jgi:hypothetical protein
VWRVKWYRPLGMTFGKESPAKVNYQPKRPQNGGPFFTPISIMTATLTQALLMSSHSKSRHLSISLGSVKLRGMVDTSCLGRIRNHLLLRAGRGFRSSCLFRKRLRYKKKRTDDTPDHIGLMGKMAHVIRGLSIPRSGHTRDYDLLHFAASTVTA